MKRADARQVEDPAECRRRRRRGTTPRRLRRASARARSKACTPAESTNCSCAGRRPRGGRHRAPARCLPPRPRTAAPVAASRSPRRVDHGAPAAHDRPGHRSAPQRSARAVSLRPRSGARCPPNGDNQAVLGDQLVRRRGDRRLRPVVHVELGVQPLDVRLHRLHRQVQLVGDLGVGQPPGDQREHLRLPIGQLDDPRWRAVRRRRPSNPTASPATMRSMLSTSRSADRVFSTTPDTPTSCAALTNSGAASHVYSTTWLGACRRGPSRPPGRACGGGRRTCRTGRRRPARVGPSPVSSSTTSTRWPYGASMAARHGRRPRSR